MSGFLGQIAGSLLGSGPAAAAAPVLIQMLMGGGAGSAGAQAGGLGGLGGLLSQFESAGLGAQVQSWVGSGSNMPLTAEHVMAAIPPDQLAMLAEKVGLPHDQAAALIAQVLPHVVDHATPDGQVPAAGAATPDFAGLIGKLLG